MKEPRNRYIAEVLEQAGSVTQLALDTGVTESAARHWVRVGRVPKPIALLLATKYEVHLEGLQRAPSGDGGQADE